MTVERTRFSPDKPDSGRFISELQADGFAVKAMQFVNVRLRHERARSNEVLDIIAEKKPDIVLLESYGHIPQGTLLFQQYIEGKVPETALKLRPGLPLDILQGLRHRYSNAPDDAPVLVCSDVQKSEITLDTEIIYNLFDKIAKNPLEPDMDFIVAKEYVRSIVRDEARSQKSRESRIANEFTKELKRNPSHVRLKQKEELTVVAPYGMLHGRLNQLFTEGGSKTSSIVLERGIQPLASLLLKFIYDMPVEDRDLEDALVGALIVNVVSSLVDRKELPKLSQAQQISVAWRMLTLLRKEEQGPDGKRDSTRETKRFNDLYMLAKSDPSAFINQIVKSRAQNIVDEMRLN